MKYELVASCTIHARALAKERPRTGKNGHVYTPKRTQEYEKIVRHTAISQLDEGHVVPTGPVKLVVEIFDEVPMSWGPKKRASALMGDVYPQRGDLDNRVKAIQDALNGVYYVDDKQIVKHQASMEYGQQDAIYIAVYKINKSGSRNEGDNKGSAGLGG